MQKKNNQKPPKLFLRNVLYWRVVVAALLLVAVVAGVFFLQLFKEQALISSTSVGILADLRQQQQHAHGYQQSSDRLIPHGVYFTEQGYYLFEGSDFFYAVPDSVRFISVAAGITLDTSFPDKQVVFEPGSGNVQNYDATANVIRVSATESSISHTVTFNRYGIITSQK